MPDCPAGRPGRGYGRFFSAALIARPIQKTLQAASRIADITSRFTSTIGVTVVRLSVISNTASGLTEITPPPPPPSAPAPASVPDADDCGFDDALEDARARPATPGGAAPFPRLPSPIPMPNPYHTLATGMIVRPWTTIGSPNTVLTVALS